MIWVDYLIVGIILISTVVSVLRGFVREALSLATWIVAIWVALRYAEPLSSFLSAYIEPPSVRLGTAFAILFLIVLLLGGLLNSAVSQLVEKSGLSGTDRSLGAFFGLARGLVLVVGLVLVAGLTPLPSDPWWDQSRLIKYFEGLAIQIRGYMPPEVARSFVYD